MLLTEEKIKARVSELASYRYRDRRAITHWFFTEDKQGKVGEYPPDKHDHTNRLKLGDHWKGRDLYVWLFAIASIPADWMDKKVVGLFDFGRTGGGNNSGFESLLFINQSPYQGVDSNHQEVFLAENLAGTDVKFDFRLWSGLEGGGAPTEQEYKLRQAELAWLDTQVDNFYFDAKATLETIFVLDDHFSVKHQLLRILNEAFRLVNWMYPGSTEFYNSVYEASNYLTHALGDIEKQHDVTFHAIGHTHIDVAWLWQLKHTREKSARSFSTVLRLMEQYPEYVFLQSQPQLYEYIKQDYPTIYKKMQKKISDGHWEVDGGMWLEADCNIPSGESLVRQLLLGTKFIREEFDHECEYLWLPDVFGYSWALPQILKKSGIKTFMTTKISWNQFNRMPHDTFMWRGIDGSEILTHFITTIEPWPDSKYYTYNGFMTPKVVKESWEAYKDKQINQDLLISYGYGDGGGGVNREMLEMRRRMDTMPGLPHVKPAKAKDYFNKLHRNIQETNDYVHTWDGELYLEFHRGTYTSQAFMKRMNRKLELLYRETEWLSVLNQLINETMVHYPEPELTTGWKIILRNQFHDIIPGSSIKEVYDDARREYQEAQQIGSSLWHQAASLMVEETDILQWTVFNSASWQRNDLLFIPRNKQALEAGNWSDGNGNSLQAQQTTDGWYIQVNNVPAMGYKTIHFSPGTLAKEKSPFHVKDSSIVTPFYSIQWNEKGQLTSIFDLKNDREVLAENERGNVLQVFEDKPLMFDAWDIDIFYQQKMQEINELKSVEVVELGELRAVICFKWQYAQSVIVQDMIVYNNTRRIDFQTMIDWKEKQQLLKAAFSVDIRSTEATYDIQFGNVKRPTHWNTSWDYARFESVAHQWADLSEGGYGVSLLNDCKYGYDIKDHVMRISLLKSPIHPDPTADQGEHVFTYALFPHEGDWRQAKTVQEAWALNNPFTFKEGDVGTEKSLFHFTNQNLMIDAVKKAEYSDEVIVRIHEYEGRRTATTINSDFHISSWQECNLLEKPITEKIYEQHLECTFKPYEIKTFVVGFSDYIGKGGIGEL